MSRPIRIPRPLLALSLTLMLPAGLACDEDDDGGGGGGGAGGDQAALADEIAEAFPFAPDAGINVLYQCGRTDSVLAWYFQLSDDGSLIVAFTTDANEDFAFPGSYTHRDGAIRLQMPGGFDQPFPQGLDETSTVLFPQLGIVAAFATPNMVCVAIGHGENPRPPEPTQTANYDCPIINFEVATDDDNAIELVHAAVPFSTPVGGSIFRQRDRWIVGVDQPNVQRGYGIYRIAGDRFYASFRVAADFAVAAGGALPIPLSTRGPFDDFNLLSGRIAADGASVTVDQLDPAAGPCTLR